MTCPASNGLGGGNWLDGGKMRVGAFGRARVGGGEGTVQEEEARDDQEDVNSDSAPAPAAPNPRCSPASRSQSPAGEAPFRAEVAHSPSPLGWAQRAEEAALQAERGRREAVREKAEEEGRAAEGEQPRGREKGPAAPAACVVAHSEEGEGLRGVEGKAEEDGSAAQAHLRRRQRATPAREEGLSCPAVEGELRAPERRVCPASRDESHRSWQALGATAAEGQREEGVRERRGLAPREKGEREARVAGALRVRGEQEAGVGSRAKERKQGRDRAVVGKRTVQEEGEAEAEEAERPS
ncbi:hypothetical protein JCM10213_003930 [Rhodosporidiobolus nylandii]